MAIITKTASLKEPKGISNTQGRTLSYGNHFSIEIRGIDPTRKQGQVAVSKYSSVLLSPDPNDKLELIGLDFELDIIYGNKIWLEIFYDTNLTAVFGFINFGNKWTNKIVNPQRPGESNELYSEELEFITKFDLNDRIKEIENLEKKVEDMKLDASEYYEKLFTLGYYTREETDKLKTASNTAYDKTKKKVNNYKNTLNDFFIGGITYKKLYKSYTLIAYTTKDFNVGLKGNKVFLPNIVSTNTQTQRVPQAQEDSSFKIVPCVENDLILVDICHENRFAAKMAIPFHGAIYPFLDRFGKIEETINTK